MARKVVLVSEDDECGVVPAPWHWNMFLYELAARSVVENICRIEMQVKRILWWYPSES